MSTKPVSRPPAQTLSTRALHVIDRFTYGYNTDLLSQARGFSSIDAWFTDQLRAPRGLSSATIDGWFPQLTRDSPSAAQQRVQAGSYPSWDYARDFVAWTLARRVLSGNQVHEVMVDFWSNLLHIPANTSATYALRFGYDRLIRTYALTSFRELLAAAIFSPAMNSYLTNYKNRRGGINENLGRELLELHTVGIESGFTQADVQASANLLTGFTLDFWKTWAFGYDPSRHVTGPQTVLGQTFANSAQDGRDELRNYVDFLAMHECTAGRIAKRLCTRFVSDDPPDDVVEAVKQSYLDSGSDVKTCLTTLLSHPSFATSVRAKVRTPVEDVIAGVRALGIRPTGRQDSSFLDRMSWYCTTIGQTPFEWPRPDGFPETTDLWATPARLLRSWTVHTYLTGVKSAQSSCSVPTLASTLPHAFPVAFSTLVHHQSVRLTGRQASRSTIAAAATTIGLDGSEDMTRQEVDEWMIRNIRSVILSTPSSMRR